MKLLLITICVTLLAVSTAKGDGYNYNILQTTTAKSITVTIAPQSEVFTTNPTASHTAAYITVTLNGHWLQTGLMGDAQGNHPYVEWNGIHYGYNIYLINVKRGQTYTFTLSRDYTGLWRSYINGRAVKSLKLNTDTITTTTESIGGANCLYAVNGVNAVAGP